MHPRAEMFLRERQNAVARGDGGVVRCMNVELERMGFGSPPLEAAVPVPLERAVPEKPRGSGRPKMPRCEHGQIVGRCLDCGEDGV